MNALRNVLISNPRKISSRSLWFIICIAVLFVVPKFAIAVPAVPNDNLSGATVITTVPFSQTVDNTGATEEANEIGNYNDDYSFWYTITPTADSAIRVSAINDSANPVVGLYTGTAHPLNYADGRGDADDNLDNVGQFSENFVWRVEAGTTYYIRIASYSEGPIEVTIDTPALTPMTNDDLADATIITDYVNEYIDMATATLEVNENVYSSSITSSLWYTVTPATDALLVVLEDGEFGDHALGLYTGSTFPLNMVYCRDYDNRGSDSEGYVKALTGGTTYYIQVSSRENPGVVNVRIALMPMGTFSNDDLADAKEITSGFFGEYVDNTGGTIELNESITVGDDYSFWYSVTPDGDSTVTITAAALDGLVDPSIGIYTGALYPLTEIESQDFDNLFYSDSASYASYGGGEAITVDLEAGATYYVRIASKTEGPVGVAIAGLQFDDDEPDSDSSCFITTARQDRNMISVAKKVLRNGFHR